MADKANTDARRSLQSNSIYHQGCGNSPGKSGKVALMKSAIGQKNGTCDRVDIEAQAVARTPGGRRSAQVTNPRENKAQVAH